MRVSEPTCQFEKLLDENKELDGRRQYNLHFSCNRFVMLCEQTAFQTVIVLFSLYPWVLLHVKIGW